MAVTFTSGFEVPSNGGGALLVAAAGATITSASFSAVANAYYVLSVYASQQPSVAPTSTHGITFTLLGSQSLPDSSMTLYLYGGQAASSGSGTISFGFDNGATYGYHTVRVNGATPTPVVQIASASGSQSNVGVTPATASNTQNRAAVFIGLQATNYGGIGNWNPMLKSGGTGNSYPGYMVTGWNPTNSNFAAPQMSINTPAAGWAAAVIEFANQPPAAHGAEPVVNSLMLLGMGV